MIEDTAAYREIMRMNREDFKRILKAIEPDITPRQVMGGHEVIVAAERLTVTLPFLATVQIGCHLASSLQSVWSFCQSLLTFLIHILKSGIVQPLLGHSKVL